MHKPEAFGVFFQVYGNIIPHIFKSHTQKKNNLKELFMLDLRVILKGKKGTHSRGLASVLVFHSRVRLWSSDISWPPPSAEEPGTLMAPARLGEVQWPGQNDRYEGAAPAPSKVTEFTASKSASSAWGVVISGCRSGEPGQTAAGSLRTILASRLFSQVRCCRLLGRCCEELLFEAFWFARINWTRPYDASLISGYARIWLIYPKHEWDNSKLTALLGVAVVADQGLLGVSAEESCPVDGVVIAELTVVGDVHVSSTDLIKRLQLEWWNPLLLQHQKRDATKHTRKHKGYC